MSSISDFIDPGGKILSNRLDQFCLTLETLGERLRSTIATILGDTIGNIVRDTAMRVLDNLTGDLARAGHDSTWTEYTDGEPYWDDPSEDVCGGGVQRAPSAQGKLPAALSAGLQAASWWLRRWTGQSPVVTTIAVGVVAAGIAYVGGPVAAVLLGLASSVTQFIPLAEAVRPGYEPTP